MSYVALLASLFAVDMLAAMSPGPNFVLVTQTAIRRTRRHAAAVVAGFVTTNLLWCVAVLLGLTALFELAPWLYRGIRIAGGAYLIYLGISAWRSHAAAAARVESSTSAAYIRGILTNLSNPKSVVYFGSIFALFMKPGTPVWVQLAGVAIVLANTVLWYGSVAALFSRTAVQRRYEALRRPINAVAGTVMAAFGVRLLLARD